MKLKRLTQEDPDEPVQALNEHSAEAIYVLDAAGRIVGLNQPACDNLGWSRQQLTGTSPARFDACWDEAFPRGVDARLSGAETVSFRTKHQRQDGTVLPVHVQVVPLPPGAHAHALLVARPLDERGSAAEAALDACEERFRTLVQLSFDVYWETDAQHRFTRQEFSPRLADAPQSESEIGKTRWEVPNVGPDEDAWRAHRAILDAHLPFTDFELTRPVPGGGLRHVSVSGFPVHDRSGRFVGYRGVGRHVTPLKRAEAEHRAHLWFLESVDRTSRAMRAGQDLDGMSGEVLQALLDVFACDRAWLVHSSGPQAATWRAVAQRTRSPWPAAFEPGTDVAMDQEAAAVFTAAKDSTLPVLLLPPVLGARCGARSQMAMAIQPKGAPPHLLGLHQCSHAREWTVHEQHLFGEIAGRLTDALTGVLAFTRRAESERRLEAAQRIAHVGWWERDLLTGELLASDEACRIFGVDPAELPQWKDRWLGFVDADDRPRTVAALEAALAGGPRYDVEYRLLRRDGSRRVVHSQGDLIRDDAGRPVRLFGVMQDITELRRAEGALRESEARFRIFVDRATDAFFLLDAGLVVVDVNRQACEGLGYSREELVGMHPRQFDAGMDESSIERIAQRAGAGQAITFETAHRRRDGSIFPVEIRTGTFRLGERLLYLALARDISDRKIAEDTVRAKDQALQALRAELARMSRVMTIGELTASIAHEVNQPLGAMVANAAAAVRWLSAEPPDAANARRALQAIANDGRRASEVIQRIRALVQRRPPSMTSVGLNDTIGDVIALAQHELRSNGVVLDRQLDDALPAVLGDRVQLQQVLLNLVVNAVEAMGAVQDRPRKLTVASRMDGPDRVLVQVRDTGTGIARDDDDHLFEAFHTTKSDGLGIGLSISRSIIEAHGGQLTAARNEPHGAVFSFTLPAKGGSGA